MQQVRRAAAADAEYQRWLQSPPVGTQANDGLLFTDGRLRVPADAALRTRILAELHDSATGAHCGRDRMLADAQRRFDWRGMAGDVEQYVLTCDACQRNKHSKQLKPGLLMPLPLPEEPCVHWTTDAVSGLPRSKRGFDAIQVYVDRLTKNTSAGCNRRNRTSAPSAACCSANRVGCAYRPTRRCARVFWPSCTTAQRVRTAAATACWRRRRAASNGAAWPATSSSTC